MFRTCTLKLIGVWGARGEGEETIQNKTQTHNNTTARRPWASLRLADGPGLQVSGNQPKKPVD